MILNRKMKLNFRLLRNYLNKKKLEFICKNNLYYKGVFLYQKLIKTKLLSFLGSN